MIPLDSVHAALVDDLADGLAVAAGIRRIVAGRPHVTLVAYGVSDRGAGALDASPLMPPPSQRRCDACPWFRVFRRR